MPERSPGEIPHSPVSARILTHEALLRPSIPLSLEVRVFALMLV